MEQRIQTKIQDKRRYFIGGSDARTIMGEDEGALVRLWREKRGEAEPEDLSGNLIVQLGVVTEDLNRRWYEANTGQVVTDIQERVFHPALKWMAATLDGRVAGSDAVFEAKFMLPWSFSEEGAAIKYMPQLQHNMWVVAASCSDPTEWSRWNVSLELAVAPAGAWPTEPIDVAQPATRRMLVRTPRVLVACSRVFRAA